MVPSAKYRIFVYVKVKFLPIGVHYVSATHIEMHFSGDHKRKFPYGIAHMNLVFTSQAAVLKGVESQVKCYEAPNIQSMGINNPVIRGCTAYIFICILQKEFCLKV